MMKEQYVCEWYHLMGFTFAKLTGFLPSIVRKKKMQKQKLKNRKGIHSITLKACTLEKHTQELGQGKTKNDSTAHDFELLSISCCGILIKQRAKFSLQWRTDTLDTHTLTHSALSVSAGQTVTFSVRVKRARHHVLYILLRFHWKCYCFIVFSLLFSSMLRIISGVFAGILQKQHAIFPAVVVWWHRDFISWAILKCHCNRAIRDCTRTLMCAMSKNETMNETRVTLEHVTY